MKNRKIILLAAIIVAVVFAAFEVWTGIATANRTGTLTVKATPGSLISVSQTGAVPASIGNQGTAHVRLSPGDYTVTASVGKTLVSKNVSIAKKMTTNTTLNLSSAPVTGPSAAPLPSPEVQSANQLVTLLPFVGPNFEYRISYSYEFIDNVATPTIIITAPTSQAYQDALNWIKSQGFDPSKLMISYVSAQP